MKIFIIKIFKMNTLNRQKIVTNIDFIATYISDIARLLNKLLEVHVLTTLEVQEIESERTPYLQNTQLCHIIVKKDNDSYEKFLDSLRLTENVVVFKKLQSHKNSENVWFDVEEPTKYFKGRDIEIKELEECYEKAIHENLLQFVVVTGLGGVGKSELAKVFAKKFCKEHKGNCMWINVKSYESTFKSFKRLAGEMGIPTTDNGNQIKFQELSQKVYNKLCQKHCLLVFDNFEKFENYKSTDEFKSTVNFFLKLKPSGPKRPFCLLTSRDKWLADSFGHYAMHLELNALDEGPALDFFSAYLGVAEVNENVTSYFKTIIQSLGIFPLAMQQAVAYINSEMRHTGNELENILQKCLGDLENKGKKSNVLDFPLPYLQNNNNTTTYLTWQSTIGRIAQMPEGDKALEFLKALAFLPPDNYIDAEFVNKLIEEPSQYGCLWTLNRLKEKLMDLLRCQGKCENIFDVLGRYSMVHIIEQGQTILVHRLVQEVLRIWMIENGMWLKLLEKYLKVGKIMLQKKSFDSNHINYVTAIWKHAAFSENSKKLLKKFKDIPEKCFLHYYNEGKYNESLNYISEVVHVIESINDHDKQLQLLLHMKFYEGVGFLAFGSSDEAIKIFEYVYEQQKNVFPECGDHVETYGELGAAYARNHNYVDAIKCITQSLNIIEKECGKISKQYLQFSVNLALVYQSQGRYDEALGIYSDVLPMFENLCGYHHPETLTAIHNLAIVKNCQGKHDEATKLLSDILVKQENTLGEEHHDCLATRYNLGFVKQSEGEFDEARRIYEEVLPIKIRTLGEEHPCTKIVRKNLELILLVGTQSANNKSVQETKNEDEGGEFHFGDNDNSESQLSPPSNQIKRLSIPCLEFGRSKSFCSTWSVNARSE